MKLTGTKYIIFSILLSLVFFTVFVRIESIYDGFKNTWYFYFVAITSLILIIVSINIILVKHQNKKLESITNFNLIDLSILLFLIYSFTRLFFTSTENLSNNQFIIIFLLTLLYFIWKGFLLRNIKLERLNLSLVILISAFMLSGLAQAIISIHQLYGLAPGYVNSYFKVNGTFVNPDHLAGYLVSVVPFSFGIYQFTEKKTKCLLFLKYLGIITFLLCIFILPSIYIRSSWIAAIAGILVIYYYKYEIGEKIKNFLYHENVIDNNKLQKNKILKKLVYTTLIIIIIPVLVFSLFLLKPDSAKGRLFIWKITGRMISDNPVFGKGFDRFSTEYDNYQANYFADDEGDEYEKFLSDNVKQAHNEYLQIWAELGIIGLILWLGIIVSALWGYRRNDLPPPDKNDKVSNRQYATTNGQNETFYKFKSDIVYAAKASFVSVLIFSFFSFPYHILPTFINLIFLISIISAGSFNLILKTEILIQRKIIVSFAFILLVFTGFILIKNYNLFNVYQEWNEANIFVYSGLYDDSINKFEIIYPALKKNGEFLFNYGGVLTLDKKYKQAIMHLEESKRNYSDPKQYINLGICYESLNRYKEAELNYKYAFNMVPNLLYPKYLLVKLLAKEKKIDEAKILCTEVLKSKTKVKSTAISQMKEELKNLIISLNISALSGNE